MDAIILQFLNGVDKGAAYALIALGLTLIFGTLGVVNFAHGALFMLGAFCAVTTNTLLTLSQKVKDPSITFFEAYIDQPYLVTWYGDLGATIIDWSVPISLLLAIPVMFLLGTVLERGLIRHFYNRPHADQILVTFGLAIVLGEIARTFYGANPLPQPTPDFFTGQVNIGAIFGSDLAYPAWRLLYFLVGVVIMFGVFALLQFTRFGMVVRAGMQDRQMVQLLGINIQARFTLVFGMAAAIAGVAGALYTPTLPPNYEMGMEFLVISFVVVVVGGMGSLGGAVLAGFMLGILEAIVALPVISDLIPGINQVIIYAVAVVVLLTRPRGLMGRKGVMED